MNKHTFWDFKGQVDYLDEWFLMGTPYPVALILVGYLVFVLKLGPALMKHRPPMTLRNVLLAYNIFQVVFSVFLVYIGGESFFRYGLFHKECLQNYPEIRKEILSGCYWYFFAKLTELLDTIFFVLRKKQNQVTFLHVYHHTFVVVGSWILIKYSRTDDLIFVGTLNSFVHIFMYTYYGLSVFPRIAKHLWWKKYLTKMQLIQFMLVLLHFPINLVKSKCSPSYMMLFFVIVNTILFMYLFSDFYKNTYVKKEAIIKSHNSNGTKNSNNIVDDILDKNTSKWSR